MRHRGARNHRVALVSDHRSGGCDSDSKEQKQPAYSVNLGLALQVARLVQV